MTQRTTRGAKVRAPLTGLEGDVMRAVWSLGPSTVEAVHAVVARTRDIKETTTRTLLRRLEQKGYVKHEVGNRVFLYEAVEPARSLAARAVRQIIDSFCQGSMEELVSGMVEAKVLTRKDHESLESFVRSHREQEKK